MSSSNPIESAKIIPGPGVTPPPNRSIGAMLIDSGKIRPEDGERILRYAKEKGMRFGDAAIALKLATADDIQQALAKQFDYPYLAPGDSHVSPEVVAAWAPFSHQVEALRALRSQLMLRWFTEEAGRKALAIVSPSRGDGRSYLAANLAVVFSQMGEHTLLVDADMRNPRQHTLFGLPNATGLSTILSDRAGLEVIQRIPAFVDLSILTAGAVPPNPLELLGRSNFGDLMDALAHEYDVIIVDTPPAEQGSDFQLVAQKTGGALMVARRNRSRVEACAAVSEEIAAATATLVGGVLNEF
jgi:receptor protein-tyrosine kinase